MGFSGKLLDSRRFFLGLVSFLRCLDGCDLFLGLFVFFRGSLLLPAAAVAVVGILSFFLLDRLSRPFSSLDLDRSLDLLLLLREALLDRSLLEAPLLDR